MEVAEAVALISRAIESGRTAQGYLIVGDLKEQCERLAHDVLLRLFPDATEQIERRCHPDVFFLTPQGRSRMIKVSRGKDDDGPGMRDGLVEPMSQTSFSGGWKVGVIVGADRMLEEAANAFLKSLEEPPPRTLYLLLTDAPDALLPTIVSRTQRIDLPLSDGVLEGEDYAAVEEVLGSTGVTGVYEKSRAGMRLAEILGGLKGAVQGEDVPVVRKRFYRTVMRFVRGWMVEERVPLHLAFRNIEAVEAAFRQSERYLPDESVLCHLVDGLTFPASR